MDTNRYDLLVEEATHAIDYYINKLSYDANLLSIQVPFEPVRFHLCVGKHSAFNYILPEFDATIRVIRQNGTLEKIYQKYR